jgi:hypothetical protein
MEELTIYQKHYDLILYAFPIVNAFPKSQRFVLGQQIQNCMLDIAKLIMQANKLRGNRLPILAQLDRTAFAGCVAGCGRFVSGGAADCKR